MKGETGPDAATSPESDDAARPALRVVRGNPAPEELAALAAVITASAGNKADAPGPVVTGRWAASTRVGRRLPRVGPGAWAASGRG